MMHLQAAYGRDALAGIALFGRWQLLARRGGTVFRPAAQHRIISSRTKVQLTPDMDVQKALVDAAGGGGDVPDRPHQHGGRSADRGSGTRWVHLRARAIPSLSCASTRGRLTRSGRTGWRGGIVGRLTELAGTTAGGA